MELEWDTDKATLNLQKHGVSFEDAALIFYDQGRIETYDERENYSEDRWATIGRAYSALLYAVYTVLHDALPIRNFYIFSLNIISLYNKLH
ncbi:BrnT family toxin [Xylella fastidiosa]|uniref:BrnT family toxin n=1 Tax=Xylella fastidiosa TaxID=2371 RepID=UPI0034DDE4E8